MINVALGTCSLTDIRFKGVKRTKHMSDAEQADAKQMGFMRDIKLSIDSVHRGAWERYFKNFGDGVDMLFMPELFRLVRVGLPKNSRGAHRGGKCIAAT